MLNLTFQFEISVTNSINSCSMKPLVDNISKQLLRMSGRELLQVDPLLQDYADVVEARWGDFKHMLNYISDDLGGLDNISNYIDYGFYIEVDDTRYSLNQLSDLDDICRDIPTYSGRIHLVYREWAENARSLSIVGDFNCWDKAAHPAVNKGYGIWECRIPFYVNQELNMLHCPIHHRAKFKIFMVTRDKGEEIYRMPQRTLYAVHNHERCQLEPLFYCHAADADARKKNELTRPYPFTFENPQGLRKRVHRIYECHVGMSSSEPKINTYRDFADTLLPIIKEKGYNVIQLMAIQEHSYYGSFGYQVTSFFAPSSRFGTPDDLKYLIDKAHEAGIAVLLDLVHSHASKNVEDGIADWDGSTLFFYKEDHPLWDSKIFNYKNPETLRFLLQNVRWWLQEFRIDGFRFDGVMSLMYYHRSAGVGYTGRYGEYFDEPQSAVDVGGLTYLRLAHTLIKMIEETECRDILTIAEDVSGYPCMATPILDGGIGFDYRFQMAVPDLWITMMKNGFDMGLNDFESIDVKKIAHTLTNRRWQEKHIVYCECHDQALVGDKTLSMWLLNENIYDQMSILHQANDRTLRAIRLHKVIRLLTMGLGGEGYLTFFGNEFGHPEWIDFPRVGNNWSYHYCRRQWNLDYWGADGQTTRYADLGRFDRDLMRLNAQYEWNVEREYITRDDNEEKLIAFERKNLLFVCSLHPFNSDYEAIIPVRQQGKYRVIFHTNTVQHGGTGSGTVEGNELVTRNKMNKKNNDLNEDQWDAKMNGLQYYIKLWIKHQCGYILELCDKAISIPDDIKSSAELFSKKGVPLTN